jgi:CRISPR/Cas system-associated exonuclease Cas4 (RecB family)
MQKPHPYIQKLGIDAIPFQHNDLGRWRANFTGISYVHEPTNFHLFGAVDDIWQNVKTGELIVVDYKATSKASEVNIDAEWQMSYKYQMEFYQYLLRKNGFLVSDKGYFVYCNGIADNLTFNEQLHFRVSLIPYQGQGNWIEDTILGIHSLLSQHTIPAHEDNCAYCNYQRSLKDL